MSDALARFSPAVRRWFEAQYAAPTAVQAASWPIIASGRHTLITAPTGSGKTLTAFLWSLDGFVARRLATGATRVLYVSPLKALNNDIQRNLLTPLAALNADRANGQHDPIRVGVRSGDTDSSERRRLLRRPPEILITTPESLSIMLTTSRGQLALNQVETVILDEVHALLDSRRGVQLLTALERLVTLTGEVQRIAISATVTPLAEVARYVGGADAKGAPRAVEIVAPPGNKIIDLRVRFPASARDVSADAGAGAIWDPLAIEFRRHIDANRSTLFFTNSRRLAEKVAYKLNEAEPEPLAYAHHGSLARNLRFEVEARMKAGTIKAIVATSSLELGIDIGALDEVVMVQSPGSVAAGLQRLGRAGHQVDAVSRGTLYPTHAHDCLEAAVLTAGINDRALEPIQLLHNPLDVLAQSILSICATEPWPVDDLYALICQSGPYRTLPRRSFDDVINMLAGRYRGLRITELTARLDLDRTANTVQATRGAIMALYLSGGSIPERGLFQVRHADSGTLIGELDEEYVWEASVGQRFNLGSQSWQITRIDKNEVLARSTTQRASLAPFWRADALNRNPTFGERLNCFLRDADKKLNTLPDTPVEERSATESFEADLRQRSGFDATAAAELVAYLKRQRAHTGVGLPHIDHLVIEHTRTAPGGYTGAGNMTQTVVHTLWGGAINRPWAIALEAAFQVTFEAPLARASVRGARSDSAGLRAQNAVKRDLGQRSETRAATGVVEVHVDDNCIIFQHDGSLDVEALLRSVTSDNLLELLQQQLEGSGYFGAHFRQAAGRALLLSKASFRKRLPLWLVRQQAKKLLAAVKHHEDFPILAETWRSCLQDEFDLPRLRSVLDRLATGALAVSSVHTAIASPFAAHAAYQQTMPYMYADDQPQAPAPTSLSESALALAMAGTTERPPIAAAIIAAYEERRQRRTPEYRPTDADDALRWINERLLLPESQWPLLAGLKLPGDRLRILNGEPRCLIDAGQAAALIDSGWFERSDLADVDAGTVSAIDSATDSAAAETSAGAISAAEAAAKPSTVSAAAAADACPARAADDQRSQIDLALEVLAHYGPRDEAGLTALLPRFERLQQSGLLQAPALLRGRLRDDQRNDCWCRRDVYESLLRFQRAQRRATLDPLPFARWSGFVWRWQARRLAASRPEPVEQLAACLELLRGFPAPVASWLDELGACRLSGNAGGTGLLQAALEQADLHWRGVLPEQLAFFAASELALFALPLATDANDRRNDPPALPLSETLLGNLFVDPAGRYDFLTLADRYQLATGASVSRFNEQLWAAVWAGQIATDTLATVDRARVQRYQLHVARRSPRLNRRLPSGILKGWPGTWQRLPAAIPAADPLTELDLGRERARLLLQRYGVVCREIANRDHPALRWRQVFPALRMMELAGEVVAGYFFTELSGPQFADPAARAQLATIATSEERWDGWLSAFDPAAPTGLGGSGGSAAPARRAGNYLIYVGGTLALVVENGGKRLRFDPPAADQPAQRIDCACAILAELIGLRGRSTLLAIDGAAPSASPVLDQLKQHLKVTADHRQYTMEPKLDRH